MNTDPKHHLFVNFQEPLCPLSSLRWNWWIYSLGRSSTKLGGIANLLFTPRGFFSKISSKTCVRWYWRFMVWTSAKIRTTIAALISQQCWLGFHRKGYCFYKTRHLNIILILLIDFPFWVLHLDLHLLRGATLVLLRLSFFLCFIFLIHYDVNFQTYKVLITLSFWFIGWRNSLFKILTSHVWGIAILYTINFIDPSSFLTIKVSWQW